MNKQKKAFTLVELIVVITILAILGTIAFISLQWYSKDARDSIRISDTSNMKTSLELFHLDSGKYPLPDDNEIVDYGTETLWYQWDFWSSVISSLSRSMSEIPTDPLTDKEYIFSVANNKNEFEILSLLEWDSLALSNISQTNAASLEVTPKVDWNFNRVFIKTANYIVPVPSIITSEILLWTMTLDSNNISSQVVNGWENIPVQWNVISNTWALTWLVLSVYTWTISKESSDIAKVAAMNVIKDAYTWSVLAKDSIYNYILDKSSSTDLVILLNSLVLKDDSTEVAIIDPVNWLCWTDDWWNFTITPTNLCTTWNESWVTDNGWGFTYEWICNWTDWWTTDICNANNTNPSTYPWCDLADITISWIVVSACNVWSTTAWTDYTISWWWMFQWWNNSDIEFVWTSSTKIGDTTWYTPSTYSNPQFITWIDWTTVVNNDLWWNVTNTSEARKWPCSTWYHVPSQPEWENLITWWWWSSVNVATMISTLKIPLPGSRYWVDGTMNSEWSIGHYWASTPQNGSNWYIMQLSAGALYSTLTADVYTRGHSVRCFKN